MKPSGDFNSAACDTGRCWYVSEQTRDKDIWAERMSLWRLCSAVSSLVPPGHPHRGVFAWIKPWQPQAVWETAYRPMAEPWSSNAKQGRLIAWTLLRRQPVFGPLEILTQQPWEKHLVATHQKSKTKPQILSSKPDFI